MAEDPESPRHLPIHRFKSAEWNGNSALTPKGFKLDSFIESQNIGFLVSKKLLGLEVIFEPMAGFHLTETPISKNQTLKQLEDGRYLLKVKLPDTSQLRWWLLGFGGQIEIIRPISLRKEFKETSNKMTKLYK